jgi:hypothetical protein
MSTIINARSPYYIKVAPSSGTLSSVSMSLYIYSGTLTTQTGTATYTISKDIIGSNNYVIFEITELIRDYLITEYGAYSIDGVWVQTDLTLTLSDSSTETPTPTTYLAFDGYGYFEDGVNPRTSTNPAVTKISSTATGTTAYKLIDSGQTFTKTVDVGDTVTNTTDSTTTVITGIDSDTQLAVRATNFIESGDTYTIADTGNYTPQYLQSNTKIYFKKGRDIVFPVFAEAEGTVAFTTGGDADVFWNQVDEFWNLYDVNWSNVLTPITISDTNVSEDKIVYIRLTPTTDLNTGDTIVVSTTKNTPTNYVQSVTITLEEVCEPKYDFLDVVFYNKFGALQIMPFHKKSMISMDSNSESYKRNLMDFVSDPTYSKEKHSVRQFQVTGKEKIQMNSGFIDESFNEVIKQLMLSEQVWVYDGTEVKPIILDTKSLQFKTSVNDKLINYTFDFSYAFNKVNDIR